MPYKAQKPLNNGGVIIQKGQVVDVTTRPLRAIKANLGHDVIRWEDDNVKPVEPEKPKAQKPKSKFTCSSCGDPISGQGKTGLCKKCNCTKMRNMKAKKE